MLENSKNFEPLAKICKKEQYFVMCDVSIDYFSCGLVAISITIDKRTRKISKQQFNINKMISGSTWFDLLRRVSFSI